MSKLPSTDTMMKPLANKAILDEALRFQGTLSWTQSSWEKGLILLLLLYGASASTQEVGSNGVECKDPLSNKDFTKLVDFNRYLGMPVQGFEKEI
ncbi:hypothetical protein AAG906_016600 [Vitis piasezkii]